MKALLWLPKLLVFICTLGRVNMFKFKPGSGFPEEIYFVSFRPRLGVDLKKVQKVYEQVIPGDTVIVPEYFGEYQEDIVKNFFHHPPRTREVELEGLGNFPRVFDFWESAGCCNQSPVVFTLLSKEDAMLLENSDLFFIPQMENVTDRVYSIRSKSKKKAENSGTVAALIKSGKLPERCYDCGAPMTEAFDLDGQECTRCWENYLVDPDVIKAA